MNMKTRKKFRNSEVKIAVAERGGSWNSSHGLAAAVFRSRGYPNYRYVNIGFRVVGRRPSLLPSSALCPSGLCSLIFSVRSVGAAAPQGRSGGCGGV